MPGDFHQTSSALRTDREGSRRALLWFALLGGILVLVGSWAHLARVPVYAVSESARLRARDDVHPVDILVSGRVVSVDLPIGGRVRMGAVLVALDDTDVALRLEQARASERGLSAQIDALQAELDVREEAQASTGALGQANVAEARAARSETAAAAALATEEQARTQRLLRSGVVAEAEVSRANATMAQANAEVLERSHRLSALDSQTRRDIADRRAWSEGLRRSLAALVAERDRASILAKRLEVERARHTVSAPIDGSLGQIRAPRVGSMVEAGQTVAVVTPETGLEIHADFEPADAIGHVRPGQPARMRVTGFPWTQYGMLSATVTAVSSEVLNGRLRVRLALDERGLTTIPLQHGLVGDVEIELEEVSPAILVSRAAGQLFERTGP